MAHASYDYTNIYGFLLSTSVINNATDSMSERTATNNLGEYLTVICHKAVS